MEDLYMYPATAVSITTVPFNILPIALVGELDYLLTNEDIMNIRSNCILPETEYGEMVDVLTAPNETGGRTIIIINKKVIGM